MIFEIFFFLWKNSLDISRERSCDILKFCFVSATCKQTHADRWNVNTYSTASNGAFGAITMWSVRCPFRSGWFANMVSSFAFVVIKGPSRIKIISARNQDINMVYEAVIKVDVYGVGLANTHAQL
jgi:hypothetical protein